MLKHLKIRNFAIIDEVEIDFGSGLNIISGETGAGKSILMDALILLLGGRASSNLIRSGAEEASVEALFVVGTDDRILQSLESHGIPSEDGELIVRRIVHCTGKNRIFVNGCMANTSILQSITSSLVDLCSQHDQQLLANPEEQLFWIDRFGGFEEERTRLRALYSAWKEKQRTLDSLSTDSAQREQRIDFLRFQIQELEDAGITVSDEDARLEQELKVLENGERLFAFAAETEKSLLGSDESEDGPALVTKVMSLLQTAKQLSALDPKIAQAAEFLEILKINAEELARFARSYGNGISRDESRLEELNARLALLSKLKKNTGPRSPMPSKA